MNSPKIIKVEDFTILRSGFIVLIESKNNDIYLTEIVSVGFTETNDNSNSYELKIRIIEENNAKVDLYTYIHTDNIYSAFILNDIPKSTKLVECVECGNKCIGNYSTVEQEFFCCDCFGNPTIQCSNCNTRYINYMENKY